MRKAATFLAALSLTIIVDSAHAGIIVGHANKVHDGDTLTLSTGAQIRVFGIDAPELHQQCFRNDACAPCGYEARAKLTALAVGELVCEQRGTSYSRLVARCLAGGVDLALAMVQSGQAVVYERYLKKSASLKALYLDAEAGAKAARIGIWAGGFVAPGEWRGHRARLECER